MAVIISGCAPLGKFIIGKRGIAIPQIVAYLEPVFKENKIRVTGKIVIQNPTESALDLDKIFLTITDENNAILGQDILSWENPRVISKQEREAAVGINLGLSVLNKKSLTVFIRTTFTYKAMDLRIPIQSKVAVIDLDALKETIARPLYVNIFTKFHSNIFGRSSIQYILSIANPLSIDLVLEDSVIRIYSAEGKDFLRISLAKTLFKGSQSRQITGSINVGNILSKLIRNEISKRHPLIFQLSGKLRVPDTEIYIPFKIESTQEISISFF